MEATLAGAGDGPSLIALKADPGRVALESVLRVAGRLSFIRGLALPREALAGIGPSVIERLRRRVARGRAAGRCAGTRVSAGSACSLYTS
jgi:hypothetical protein